MPTDNDEVPPTYASTQTISSPDPTNPPPVSSQAKDRWGILRRAIVSKSSSSCERKSSIHRFTGFRTYVTRSQSVTVGDEYVGRLSTVRISRYRTRRRPDLQGDEDPPRAPVSAEEEYDSDKDSPGHPLYKTAYRIRVATCGLRCLDLDPDVTLIAAGHAISTLLDLYAAMERRGAVKAMASIRTGMHEVVGGGSGTLAVGLTIEDDELEDGRRWRCAEYCVEIPGGDGREGSVVVLRTREPAEQVGMKMNLAKLVSHREEHGGVDSTGLVRVWDAEMMLVRVLFKGVTSDYHDEDSEGVITNLAEKQEQKDDEPDRKLLGLKHIFNLSVPTNNITPDESDVASNGNHSGRSEGGEPCASPVRILRVIELGSGMAGLGGLALAALDHWGPAREDGGTKVQVLLTDGHIEAVQNNAVNCLLTDALHEREGEIVEENESPARGDEAEQSDNYGDEEREKSLLGVNTTLHQNNNIRVKFLKWDDGPVGAAECQSITRQSCFQLCLVSDCLHFEHYHGALFATIGRVVSVGGIAVLVQPLRGKSLPKFRKLVASVNSLFCPNDENGISQLSSIPLFEEIYIERYDEDIWQQHKSFLATYGNLYDPNIHYPVLLILKKLRPYDEIRDTAAAKKHMNERKSNVS